MEKLFTESTRAEDCVGEIRDGKAGGIRDESVIKGGLITSCSRMYVTCADVLTFHLYPASACLDVSSLPQLQPSLSFACPLLPPGKYLCPRAGKSPGVIVGFV